jgi:hypothetical protein
MTCRNYSAIDKGAVITIAKHFVSKTVASLLHSKTSVTTNYDDHRCFLALLMIMARPSSKQVGALDRASTCSKIAGQFKNTRVQIQKYQVKLQQHESACIC